MFYFNLSGLSSAVSSVPIETMINQNNASVRTAVIEN